MAQQQKNGQEPDLNQLRKVRREKLAELQQNGKDPFVITNMIRHTTARKSRTTMMSWKENRCPSQDV